jgi:transposase-like protein
MQNMTESAMIPELRKVLKRLHYPLEVMLVCARWYAAYPLSFRHLEEMMQERGVFFDHCTVYRWALKILPVMTLIFRRRKRLVGASWRMDETYIKVAAQWKYLYRAVDKSGDTVDFSLTAKRDLAAARSYLERAINLHGLPDKINIDKSGAKTAAIRGVNDDACVDIERRQSKYLNNNIEQDHLAVNRITNPMMWFKSFWSAQKLIAGIETMHMVKMGSWTVPMDNQCPQQFSSTAWHSEIACPPRRCLTSQH